MITSILRSCAKCGITLDPETHNQLCDCCWSILESLATPYWHRLHAEWLRENVDRMPVKDRILHPEQEDSDGEDQAT